MTSILRHPYIYSKPQTSIQHNPNSYLRQWHLSYATRTFTKNLRHLFNTIQTAIYDSEIYLTPPLHLCKTSDIYSTQSKLLFTTLTPIFRQPSIYSKPQTSIQHHPESYLRQWHVSYATLTFIPNLRHLFNTIQTAIYDSDIYLTPSLHLFETSDIYLTQSYSYLGQWHLSYDTLTFIQNYRHLFNTIQTAIYDSDIYLTPALHLFKTSDIYSTQSRQLFTTVTPILRHPYIYSKLQTFIQHNQDSHLRQWHLSYATLTFIPNLRNLFNTIQTAIYDSGIYFTPLLHLFKTSDIYLTQSRKLLTRVTPFLRHPYIYSKPQTSIQHNPNSYLRQWYLSYATLTFIPNLRHLFNTIQTAIYVSDIYLTPPLHLFQTSDISFNTIQTVIYDSDIYLTPPLHLFQTSDIYSTQSKQLFYDSDIYSPTLTFTQNLRHLFNTIQTAIHGSDIYLTPPLHLFKTSDIYSTQSKQLIYDSDIYLTPLLHSFKTSDIYSTQSKQLFTTVTSILRQPYIYSKPQTSIQHNPNSYLRQWYLPHATLRFIQNLRHLFNTIQTAIHGSDTYLTPPL